MTQKSKFEATGKRGQTSMQKVEEKCSVPCLEPPLVWMLTAEAQKTCKTYVSANAISGIILILRERLKFKVHHRWLTSSRLSVKLWGVLPLQDTLLHKSWGAPTPRHPIIVTYIHSPLIKSIDRMSTRDLIHTIFYISVSLVEFNSI